MQEILEIEYIFSEAALAALLKMYFFADQLSFIIFWNN